MLTPLRYVIFKLNLKTEMKFKMFSSYLHSNSSHEWQAERVVSVM